MASHLITNVRILDGTGREPFAGSVRVEGQRITEVVAGSLTATGTAPGAKGTTTSRRELALAGKGGA